MEKLTVTTIDGQVHEMKPLTGRAYRMLSEFDKNLPQIEDDDYIERHAAIVAELFGIKQDDVLDMPLEDILPISIAARTLAYSFTWLKLKETSKNAEADKAQSA